MIKPVVEANPGSWGAQYAYGRAMVCLGDLKEGRHALEIAVARNPNDLDVVFALANCMENQGDTAKIYLLLRNAGAQVLAALCAFLAQYASSALLGAAPGAASGGSAATASRTCSRWAWGGGGGAAREPAAAAPLPLPLPARQRQCQARASPGGSSATSE